MRHRWGSLSEEAQELVMGLLNYDPSKRLTAQQVYILPSSLHPAICSSPAYNEAEAPVIPADC